MTDADAIRSGLLSPDAENIRVPVIEDVQFDHDAGTWTIRMRDAMSTTENQDEIDIRVEDVESVE